MRAPPSDQPYLRVAYGEQELEFIVQPWFDVDVLPEREAARQYDVVIAGVGAPRDATLYEALGAAEPLVAGLRPVVREGGALVIPARLDEGAGSGDLEGRVEPLLARCLVVIAASEAPEAVRLARLRASVDVEEALDIAFEHIGRPRRASVLLVPRVSGLGA